MNAPQFLPGQSLTPEDLDRIHAKHAGLPSTMLVACWNCGGSGWKDVRDETQRCAICAGKGQIATEVHQ